MRRFCLRRAGWLIVACFAVAGCDLDTGGTSTVRPPASPPTGTTTAAHPASVSSPTGDTIRIATFNIQVFGTSKIGKPDVMQVLTDVIRRFDVVAIQEIRATDQSLMTRFIEQINADGSHYDFVLGPRLGRTSSKEQYAYVFNAERIEVARNSVYTVEDPHDLMHREPLVARFRVRGPAPSEAFTFTLVNIHTDPDETDIELDALDDVFRAVQRDGSGEDDIILLGDLNVDERSLGELGHVANIYWVISGVPTNTRGTKTYDNILFDRHATSEFAGRAGVLSLTDAFGLTMEQALEVSDHLPVWSEFRAYEGTPGPIAARPGEPTLR